jgi:hypothetical protein
MVCRVQVPTGPDDSPKKPSAGAKIMAKMPRILNKKKTTDQDLEDYDQGSSDGSSILRHKICETFPILVSAS